MDAIISPASGLSGTIVVPADKAICHRAALLCALVDGSTRISPWSEAVDCQQTLALVRQLGVTINDIGQGIRVHGVGLSGLRPSTSALDCGESGTTMRLACGLLAGQPFESRLDASPSLRRRPMRRIVDPLTHMGAAISGADGPSAGDIYPPLTIRGRWPLKGMNYASPVASAQVKSAVLIAGLFADGPTTVTEPSPTRDHTERLLERLGVGLTRKPGAVTVEPARRALIAPSSLAVPGDFSSAAFFIVAATIVPGSRLELRHVSLNPSRSHLLELLRRMGASITTRVDDDSWEPQGTVTVEHRPLRGITVSAEDAPLVIDELPILMVAACAAQGRTVFEGLGELRVKETDRLHSMREGLGKMGARVAADGPAGLAIEGGTLRGAEVESFGDHRTVMSLAIAGLLADGPTTIHGAACVDKSFRSFFDRLADVAGADSVRLVET